MCRRERDELSKPLLDLHPRLNIGDTILDAVDDHLSSHRDRRAVKALRGDGIAFPSYHA